MIIYPAIDLADGQCVRLKQGDMDKRTIYGDPVEMAKKWQQQGAEYLHLVDLNAAFKGEFVNKEAVCAIVKALDIPIQLGGGVRNKDDIKIRIEEVGLSRVIIGTAAVENPDLVEWAVAKYGDKIAVGIDAKDGNVAIKGWAAETKISAANLICDMNKMGVDTIIYTDISKDGMMSGPNVASTKKMVEVSSTKIIASGGMSVIGDISAIKETGASGCIIGKALYENAFTLEEALAI